MVTQDILSTRVDRGLDIIKCLIYYFFFLKFVLYMQANIREWLNATLEPLIDYAPNNADEYMPCYIKIEDLHQEYCQYTQV